MPASYPRYFVSFTVMGAETGSNPMGHTCLLISRQESESSRVEVIDSVSYYGVPPSSDPKDSLAKWIKIKMRMDVDLFGGGGYGQLQREEVRWINQCKGLIGINYCITEAEFSQLIEALKQQNLSEQQAISEAYQALREAGKKPFLYKGEERFSSAEVLQTEREKSGDEGSRLNSWNVEFSTSYGLFPSIKTGRSCKTGTLEMLRHINLGEKELAKYGPGRSRGFFPKKPGGRINYQGSGDDDIQLFSVGPYKRIVSKRTGKVTAYSHLWEPVFFQYDGEERSPVEYQVKRIAPETGEVTKATEIFYRRAETASETQLRELEECIKDLQRELKATGDDDEVRVDKQRALTDLQKSREQVQDTITSQRTRVYWAIPPQFIKLTQSVTDTDSAELNQDYQLPSELIKSMRQLVKTLHGIRVLIYNSSLRNEDLRSFTLIYSVLTQFIENAFSFPEKNRDIIYLKEKLTEGKGLLAALRQGLADSDGLFQWPGNDEQLTLNLAPKTLGQLRQQLHLSTETASATLSP